ncbi:sensor histidine kinase [Rhodococcus sp. D2-41]|uniref:sensor histidine kinase n=1 Tax=Speluncibacter jeojiensis TaxID=2710754 RepID=UPI00240FA770|nr:sensor histidine kinase [Rhodococcus sp. D2-41]MDG3011753.1 sensor histidine kinase [Rhodococcus sp. D2-41]
MTFRERSGERDAPALLASDRMRDGMQPFVSLALIIGSAWTVRPLGLHGFGLVQLILLVINSLVVLQRSIPDRFVPERVRAGTIWIGMLASAAILATASNSIASAFPFFLAGHAGYRYPLRRAVTVGAATALCSVVALLIAAAVGHDAMAWPFGLLTGLPVLAGIARRQRTEALRNARIAVEQTRRASASEAREHALAERARIARDIHDVLAHSLSGVNMQLQLADALIGRDRVVEGRVALGQAQSMVREGLTEARKAVYALRDETLSPAGAIAAMLETDPAATDLELTGTERAVDTAVAQALVRAVQESLTNARKHAPGATLSVRLGYGDAEVTVEVLNGPGTQAQPELGRSGGGMGLVGMRERVNLLGGTMESGPVTTGPFAGGWRVWVQIPA